MADSQITGLYPNVTFRFNVQIDGMKDAVPFMEVSGLDIANEVITYEDSRGIKTFVPGKYTAPSISLKRGVFQEKSALYDWIMETQYQHNGNNYVGKVNKKDVVITLLDDKGDVMFTWKAVNTFPTKLTPPSFNASSNEVAIESIELQADWVTASYK